MDEARSDKQLRDMVGRDVTVADVNRRFLRWAWAALAILPATGAILTRAEPARSAPGRWPVADVLVHGHRVRPLDRLHHPLSLRRQHHVTLDRR
jgi:hypothetical protein